ncbi:MAG: pyridoxamine kinase [Erysipelotrichaceae bacterium]|nr:pyridoxamine kinase [Erysipelotrichaceae bacterium]
MKRVVTIQDISCLGKCSLTVALPTISAMGVECAIIPTAVLSTHTAFFKGFTFRDLSEDISKIQDHWVKEEFDFDAIYTGYLGSFEQIDMMKRFIDTFKKEETKVIVDPAMADNGKLYTGFSEEFALYMRTLCNKADVILPNLTEAAFLLGREMNLKPSEEEVQEILRELVSQGTKVAILTGISLGEGKLGAYGYDREQDKFFSYMGEELPVKYHGTGDIYASAFTGALTLGFTMEESIAIAADFVVESIKKTQEDPKGNWYGVNFEQAIPMLVERIKR